MNPEDQIILIDKPAGISSFGVVAKVRGYLRAEFGHKIKVGHTGTLDPFATGLLILLSGKMTKRSNEFLKKDKVYEATLKLGYTSSTGDPEGEIVKYQSEIHMHLKEGSEESVGGYDRDRRSASPVTDRPLGRGRGEASTGASDSVSEEPSLDALAVILRQFVGRISQRVPAFSAVKINGERAYKLARKGLPVDTPTREVEIYSIDILDYHYPELTIRTHVSSGTYIRTLAEDIGKALGTGAYLTALRRIKITDYDVKDAHPLTDFTEPHKTTES